MMLCCWLYGCRALPKDYAVTNRRLLTLISVLLIACISACGSALPFDVSLVPTVSPETAPDDEFTLASFARRISDIGVEFRVRGDVRQPFFEVQGQVVDIDGKPVQVYEYRAVEEAQAAAASVTPDGNAVTRGEALTLIDWIATPHFYQRDRLVVVYVGEDHEVLDVLAGALGRPFAGANAFRIAQ